MPRRVLRLLFALLFACLLFIACGKSEKNEDAAIKKFAADIGGSYEGLTEFQQGSESFVYNLNMTVSPEGYIESIKWRPLQNAIMTDEITWTYPGAFEFVRTHFNMERTVLRQWGTLKISRAGTHLEVDADLSIASPIRILKTDADYPEELIQPLDAGGRLDWNADRTCLITTVRAEVPKFPYVWIDRSHFKIQLSPDIIKKHIVPVGYDNLTSGIQIVGVSQTSMRRLYLSHSPISLPINIDNVKLDINEGTIELPGTAYGFEIDNGKKWEIELSFCEDGRKTAEIKDRKLKWENLRKIDPPASQ